MTMRLRLLMQIRRFLQYSPRDNPARPSRAARAKASQIISPSVLVRCVWQFEPASLGHLIFVMESKDYIRPTGTGKNFMRIGFALDVPSDAERGSENAFRPG